jgi:tetratricopeptide (TPR) repeat protein
VATSSAKCYAENAGIKGHWDEELHGMDYLVYAYLQQGNNTLAKEQYDYLKSIRDVYPMNFKVAYAFAAIPARFTLETKNWKDAAGLNIDPVDLPWQKFPWQKAIFYFARVLGAVHTNQPGAAEAALKSLTAIRDTLLNQKDLYKANQVQIQLKASEAWILFKQGKKQEALTAMAEASDLEDNTEKSPVTPGEVLPARELQGDLLLEMNEPGPALVAYEADLVKHPNRFNGLYGAARAAERSGAPEKAIGYYKKLVEISGSPGSGRPEIDVARSFLKKKNVSF